jgi:hypothetical protein
MPPSNRPDKLDHEAIVGLMEQLAVHDGWLFLRARLLAALEKYRNELESPTGNIEMLRGQIATIRMVLNMPQSLRDEAARSVKGSR